MTDLLCLCRTYPVSSLCLCTGHRGVESAEQGPCVGVPLPTCLGLQKAKGPLRVHPPWLLCPIWNFWLCYFCDVTLCLHSSDSAKFGQMKKKRGNTVLATGNRDKLISKLWVLYLSITLCRKILLELETDENNVAKTGRRSYYQWMPTCTHRDKWFSGLVVVVYCGRILKTVKSLKTVAK